MMGQSETVLRPAVDKVESLFPGYSRSGIILSPDNLNYPFTVLTEKIEEAEERLSDKKSMEQSNFYSAK